MKGVPIRMKINPAKFTVLKFQNFVHFLFKKPIFFTELFHNIWHNKIQKSRLHNDNLYKPLPYRPHIWKSLIVICCLSTRNRRTQILYFYRFFSFQSIVTVFFINNFSDSGLSIIVFGVFTAFPS